MLEVARIDRAHGLRGEVLVTLISDDLERLAAGSVLRTADGTEVEVVSSRPHQHRYLVTVADVDSRERAEHWHGVTLYGEPPAPREGTLWVHEVVGAEVVTPDGVGRGSVTAVVISAASDLLELDSGALVPMVFVTDESGLPERLVVDPPEGLFDL